MCPWLQFIPCSLEESETLSNIYTAWVGGGNQPHDRNLQNGGSKLQLEQRAIDNSKTAIPPRKVFLLPSLADSPDNIHVLHLAIGFLCLRAQDRKMSMTVE